MSYYWEQLIEWWPAKLTASALLSGFVSTFGGDELLIIILFWMVCGDFSLGLFNAFKNKTFCPHRFKRGVVKYPAYCAYGLLVGVMQVAISRSLHVTMPLIELLAAYLIFTESLSVLRHLQSLGLRVPPLLLMVANGCRAKVENTVREQLGGDDDQQD